MPHAGGTHASSLRDYVQVASRRKWIIAQVALVVPLAALAFSIHQQAEYRGSAQVLLSQQDLASQLTATPSYTNVPADRAAQTQASLARVPAVARGAIDTVHAHLSPEQFLAASSVAPGVNSDLLTFNVTHHDPRLAQRLATAYADSYVRYRLRTDTAPINTALHEVETQIASVPPSGALRNSLEEKATQLRTIAALKTANASVVRASEPAVQTAPRTKRNVVLGVLLGLFLGVGLAFMREALDTRVRSAEAIGSQLGLPLLARLPEPAKKLRNGNRLVMLADRSGVQAEAFRMLRTNFEFASLGKDAQVVMVTSATEREGKSTTIGNLAVALARAGRRVVLVDLDLRRPQINQFFDLPGTPGLTQVAIGSVSLEQALAPVPVEHEAGAVLRLDGSANGNGRVAARAGSLCVLPSGPIPPDPGEFVGTARLTEILAVLRERFDVVLLDAPPLFHVGDGLVLSAKADAVLVVARLDAMRRPMLTELKRLLDTMPATKVGFVLTGAESEQGEGYSYGYGYDAREYEPRQKIETRS